MASDPEWEAILKKWNDRAIARKEARRLEKPPTMANRLKRMGHRWWSYRNLRRLLGLGDTSSWAIYHTQKGRLERRDVNGHPEVRVRR